MQQSGLKNKQEKQSTAASYSTQKHCTGEALRVSTTCFWLTFVGEIELQIH